MMFPASDPNSVHALRIGITVAKRYARRAVDRALVKRIVREGARRRAPALLAALRAARVRADVIVRLRAPLPARPTARTRPVLSQRQLSQHQLSQRQLREQLRADTDALLQRLARHLTATEARS
jgi:RNase P protein component